MKIKDLSREEFAAICERNDTYNSILKELGTTISAGNRTTVKKYIKKHKILFVSNYENLNNNDRFKAVVDPYTENSFYTRSTIRRKVIKENRIAYVCVDCGITDTWNNKTIVLQLDHINGVCDDHRLENLRFLCPNCHSQTATYGGKKAPKEKRDKRPDAQFLRYLDTENRKVERPDYVTLKGEIDLLGYRGTGKKHGVSDNAVRNWLKMYEKYENK